MNDDPFGTDGDRTVLQPRSDPPLPLLGGINRLEKAASRLLPLLISMRHSSTHPDPHALRERLVGELEAFKRAAHGAVDDSRKVTQASYVLCTALDEAAMNTPWGHESHWSQHSLLATFHGEVAGGKRFFELLKKLGRDPRENIDLLELMYVCLALGYEGRYRIAQDGRRTLAKVRDWLHERIRSVRGEPESALSVRWQGTAAVERRLPLLTPLWVIGALTLALAAVGYTLLRADLAGRAEAAIAQFRDAEAAPLIVRPIAPPPLRPANPADRDGISVTLGERLRQEVEERRVAVDESFERSSVRLLDEGIFASGRTVLDASVSPLLERIGDALERYPGRILVTGHSDDIPITSGRYASNLELSEARARSVADALGERLADPERVTAEGRGSEEPIADNSTPAGRAANRRVEITLFH